MHLVGALLVLLCGAPRASALDPNRTVSQYLHDSWGVDRGLPSETITSIAQTRDGYLWIGTDKSLIRFDGLNFQRFSQAFPTAISIGPVQELIADNRGDLWILLPSTKLLRYRDGVFEVVHGEAENGITAIGSDLRGGLLASSLALGTLYYNGTEFLSKSSSELSARMQAYSRTVVTTEWSSLAWSTGLKPHHLESPASGIVSITSTDDGSIWLGSEVGELFRLRDGQTVSVGRLTGAKVTATLAAGGSALWIGSSKGLWRWDGHRLTREGVPSNLQEIEVLSLLKDRDGNIWVGTHQAVMRIGSGGHSTKATVMSDILAPVKTLFEDREGNVWMGGERGLQRLRDSLFVSYEIDHSKLQSTGAIFSDEDRMWFAPIEGGLRWLHEGTQRAVTIAGLPRDIVYSISGGEKHEIWLGRQHGGLTRLRYAQDIFSAKTYTQEDGLPQNSIYAVYRSRDGTVWAATLSSGVSALSDGHFRTYTTADGLASNTVSSFAESANGAIWFGTPNGLSMLLAGHWKTYGEPEGLSSPEVNCLLMDASGVLWIGTTGGLAALRADKIELPAEKRDDVLHEPVFGIAEDHGGALWVATASHIVQVTPDQFARDMLHMPEMREFSYSDGLLGKEGVKRFRSVLTDSKGGVWISTDRGLSVVRLSHEAGGSPPAIVQLQSVSADGAAMDLQQSLRIPPGKSRITFRYAGLSLKDPERVRYRFRLDGFDQGWSEPTTSREATYGNLPPGHYQFHLNASNSDGIWNGKEIEIPLEVQPTLLQTNWFRAILFLCSVLMVLLVYRLRVHQLTGILNLRFDERLSERTRIAQELHDTLLQSFQGLILRFQAANQVLLSNPQEAKEALEGALDRADQALSEGRRAIQGIRSRSFCDEDIERALYGLMNEITADFFVAQGKRTVTSIISEGRSQRVHPWACEEICRIAQEALRNSFTHGNAQRIETEITFSKDSLRIRFRDDGAGIDPAVFSEGRREGHWGLVGMSERAKGLRGSLSVWSKPKVGTEIELTIPASIAFASAIPGLPFGIRAERRVERDGRASGKDTDSDRR